MKINPEMTEQVVCKSRTLWGSQKNLGVYGVVSVANELMACKAEVKAMEIQIFIPPYAYKSRLNTMRKHIERAARQLKIEQISVKGEVSPVISLPMIIVSGAGTTAKSECGTALIMGHDIVLTGWIGLEGMLRIAGEKEQELNQRFTPSFLKQIQSYEGKIWAAHELQIAESMQVPMIRQITDGGILAALWNLALELETGLALDLKKMSIRQETVEVCEHYRLNPYQLASAGCMLMAAPDGEALAEKLAQEGVQASVIGKVTDNNDKVIYNGEDVRYIDRPAPDELMKLYTGFQEAEEKK